MSKILIVEDDPYVMRFYQNLFRMSGAGYQVFTASNGPEGMAVAKTELPDLILLDVIMPEMSGLDVLEALKADPITQNVTVIMLTNISDTETVQKSVKLGASGFIIKSDTPPQKLMEEIQKHLPKPI